MIKAIIFDCFGVLTVDTWREFCATLPTGPISDKAHQLNHQYDSGNLSLKEFLSQIKNLTGSQPHLVEEIPENKAIKNLELLKYISTLKKEYKIGILSNIASNWISDSFLNKDEQQLFDVMVFSYQVGLTKPDPKIFNLVCKKIGVDNNQAVMIDDIDSYCESAKKTGMRAITYQNFNQLKNDLNNILNNHNY